MSALAHLAFALWPGRASRRADVVFGSVVPDASHAARALPLRIAFGGLDVAVALRRTHDALAALAPHAGAPLASLPSPTPFVAVLDLRRRCRAGVGPAIVVRGGSRGRLRPASRTRPPAWIRNASAR